MKTMINHKTTRLFIKKVFDISLDKEKVLRMGGFDVFSAESQYQTKIKNKRKTDQTFIFLSFLQKSPTEAGLRKSSAYSLIVISLSFNNKYKQNRI